MPRVVHFEITADNPERAAQFYTKVFGWKIDKWGGPMEYWLATTGQDEPGIDGGIMSRSEGFGPTTNTIGVDSIEDFVAKVKAAGGQLAVPKSAVPSMGWVAYCTDSEGNLFGLFQVDPQAK